MSEPSSQLSILQLAVRISKEAGTAYRGVNATGRAMPPVDKDDLEDVKQVINDGIRQFEADAPATGWQWRKRILQVNITGTKVEGTVDSSSDTTLVDATLSTTSGTADSASATTLVDATLSATYDTDDELIGYYCYIIAETGAGSYAPITGYTAATGTITVADWLTAGGKPGGTNPDTNSTFGISPYKILIGYYCYITAGTGIGGYAPITGFTSSNGTITVGDWLDEYGNAAGTNPTAGSTFAVTQYETVSGDIARYPLPENFGGEVNGLIRYYKDVTHSQKIEWVPESTIRAQRQGNESTGHPFMAAVRPFEPASSSLGPKRRYELILYPDPIQADVLEFPYVLVFDGVDMETGVVDSATETTLVDATRDEPDGYFDGWRIDIIDGTGRGSYGIVASGDDTYTDGTFTVDDWEGGDDPDENSIYIVQPLNNLHPAGIKFDEVVKASCLSEAEQFFKNIQGGHIERYVQKALPKAYEADARSIMFTKVGKRQPQMRTWNIVEKT